MFMAPQPWPVMQAAAELPLSTLGPPQPDDQADPDTWMAALGSLPLIAPPGRRWMYNTGASVLGVLVARATGRPFAEVLRSRIFEPLGMRVTAFFAADPSRLATAYSATPDGLAVWDPPDGQWSHAPAFPDGAAGLVSTAADLLAFARMFLDGGKPVRAGAFGWDGGLGTSWLVDPGRDLVVIVLTQRVWETAEPPSVHEDLQNAAYAALLSRQGPK